MNRPITDVIFCARTKTKYYGAYPSGFLEKARIILGCSNMDTILHVCGGKAKEYNGEKGGISLSGYGINDITIDIDPECRPDILGDVRELSKITRRSDFDRWIYKLNPPFKVATNSRLGYNGNLANAFTQYADADVIYTPIKAILIDRPYTLKDADQYKCGRSFFPELNQLLRDSLDIIPDNGLVGCLDYKFPSAKYGHCIGVYPVIAGTNCRVRVFTVWRKVKK